MFKFTIQEIYVWWRKENVTKTDALLSAEHPRHKND